MGIEKELSSLEPSAEIELFQIDATNLGGEIHYLHCGTNEIGEPIVWLGQKYESRPVEIEGFESQEGKRPRPTMTIANVNGAISELIINYDELLGARVTRIQTFARFLDAENFFDGNPHAADEEIPREVFTIKRRAAEDSFQVEFELGTPDDSMGRKIPQRQITPNCDAIYRDITTGCDWNPGENGPFFDENDKPTTAEFDRCSHCLSGCTARFGESAWLPFQGFPASQLIRS